MASTPIIVEDVLEASEDVHDDKEQYSNSKNWSSDDFVNLQCVWSQVSQNLATTNNQKAATFWFKERMANDTFFQVQGKPFKLREEYKVLETCPKWSQIHHIGHPGRNVARKSNFNDSPGSSTNTVPETPTSDTPNIVIPDDSIDVDAPLYSCGDGQKKYKAKEAVKASIGLQGDMIRAHSLTIANSLKFEATWRPFKSWVHFSKRSYLTKLRMENDRENCSRGALIVVEGLDRSGKTSQSCKLLSYLDGQGYSVESWRFPDRSTCVGEMISSYLTNKSQLDDRTIHLLFSANRWEKRSLMESKLKKGITLIVDRYSYSGVAFSSAKGLDIEWCKAPEIGLLAPDLVLYLDIPSEKAAERGGYGGERYEQLEFQKEVAKRYQILQDTSWKIIDACLPIEDVEKQMKELVVDSIVTCQKGKPLSQLW
ncbi:hypothetical protein GIB67_009248 [Kingdonia uniflora]|uniref:Thymidylate kinase n=1 Tax=Kingdonia uniflora TaxID=39325 RepID=A0A7J7N2E3_9MAGN|nr:hypothetical protein GIB67_009248 [Kingdonia uniflora]